MATMTLKVKNIYRLALFRKRLLTSELDLSYSRVTPVILKVPAATFKKTGKKRVTLI